MHQFIYTAKEAALAAIVLIPLLLVLNHFRFRSLKTTLLYTIFCIYLAGIYTVVGLPNVSYIRFDPSFNLVPFLDMIAGLKSTVLNVILFLPFGAFLPLFWKKYRSVSQTVMAGFVLSLSIEMLQLFTLRAVDVNDLITNTLGTLIGFPFGALIGKRFPSLRRSAKDFSVLISCTAVVMFFLQPVIWAVIY